MKKTIFAPMKAASIKELKLELKNQSTTQLIDTCLQLAKLRKENKELLTYILYESTDEESFINGIKKETKEQFKLINTSSYYFIKKSVRKILKNIKTQIRFSKKKQTEVELLLYFCTELQEMSPPIHNNRVLSNIYQQQFNTLQKALLLLHEDLQFDYKLEIQQLLTLDGDHFLT